MAAVTGQAIREELTKWGLVSLFEATDTGGGADRIRDTVRLKSILFPSTMFDGTTVRITGGSTAEGEQSSVDYLDATNGDLYISPVTTAAVGASDSFEIWRRGINPDDVDRAIDEALTKLCSSWALMPVSQLPNGDFEEALSGNNLWDDGGSGGTVALTTNATSGINFPNEFVRNTLLVTAASADDFAESPSIFVQPGWQYYVYVPASARGGTAELIFYNVTGSVEVVADTGTVTSTLRGWTGLEATFTVPAACQEVTIRLNQVTTGEIAEFGPVYMHLIGQRRIHLPERVISKEHVGPLYQLSNMVVGTASPFFAEETKTVVTRVNAERVGDGVILRLDKEMQTQPYAYLERRFFTTLWSGGHLGQEGAAASGSEQSTNRETGDAATTECPLDYVAAATVRLLAEQYAYKQPEEREFWAALHQRAQYELDIREREYGPDPKPRQEHERRIVVPQLPV